jgi:pyruvate/2-oxoacid:ferredoxin oxidoreductase beta subunit
MTVATTTPGRATYRNTAPYPFCPGCGHHAILDRLDEALVSLQLDPARVVLVSDIGCSGLGDQYFATSAFHGLHGRSLTYATGLKLARPELEVVVLLGDGGTGIGGAHLLSAARRNVGMTVIVFNNFNYGMTGGQHSATTPRGAFTATTPEGNLEQPLDLCATVAVNGAAFVWRGTSFDDDLGLRIAEGMRTPGFALLDVWELCTSFYVPANKASRRSLAELLDRTGFVSGVIQRREVREFAAAYRRAHAADAGATPLPGRPIEVRWTSPLDRRFHLVLAGSAGGRVRSAARLVARAAVASGLWAAQRDDYPVTVKSGHSLAELILSPRPIDDTGVPEPDALVVLSQDGRRKVAGLLPRLAPTARVFAPPALAPGLGVAGGVEDLDPAAAGRSARGHPSLVLAVAALRRLGLVPREALEAAASGDEERAAVAAGWELGRSRPRS